jgi:hypothetical protein
MGNVTMSDGSHYDPLPEGCLIGGYDENDLLYVNLYPGPERMTVDENGYTAIYNGLDTTKGLFFLGDPIEQSDMREIYRSAIEAIPVFLSMPPAEGYVFGKEAFGKWADTLLEESMVIFSHRWISSSQGSSGLKSLKFYVVWATFVTK